MTRGVQGVASHGLRQRLGGKPVAAGRLKNETTQIEGMDVRRFARQNGIADTYRFIRLSILVVPVGLRHQVRGRPSSRTYVLCDD